MNLRNLREQANLRQIDVAKALEVDQTAVSRWESGDTKPLRKYHEKLAALYGCNVKDLFSENSTSA